MVRAVPLADSQLIETVNTHFIPVFIDNRDQKRPAQIKFWGDKMFEREEQFIENFKRLSPGQSLEDGCGWGSVRLTIFRPDGEVMDVLPTGDALIPERVNEWLAGMLARGAFRRIEPVFPERSPETRKGRPDDLVVQAASRFLVSLEEARLLDPAIREVSVARKGWEASPTSALEHRVMAPSQNWFLLAREDWEALLGPRGASRGASWDVPRALAFKLGWHLSPPNENHDLEPERVRRLTMKGQVVESDGQTLVVRLTGTVERNHPWWDARDDETASARFIGYLTYDRAQDRVRSFELVTQEGRYKGGTLRPFLDVPWCASFVGHP